MVIDPYQRPYYPPIAILLVIFLLGCDAPENRIGSGELRHELFVECMELSAKITRSADDDVSDIVKACSSKSWYMTNHIVSTTPKED